MLVQYTGLVLLGNMNTFTIFSCITLAVITMTGRHSKAEQVNICLDIADSSPNFQIQAADMNCNSNTDVINGIGVTTFSVMSCVGNVTSCQQSATSDVVTTIQNTCLGLNACVVNIRRPNLSCELANHITISFTCSTVVPCPTFTTRVNTMSLGSIQLPWINTLTDCKNYCATTLANCIAVEIDNSQGYSQCMVHVSPTSDLTMRLTAPNVNQYVLNGCPSPRTCSSAAHPVTTLLTVYAGQTSLTGVDAPQFTDLNTCLNSCISDGQSCVGVDFTETGGTDSCWKYTPAANIGASIGPSPGADQWRVTRCDVHSVDGGWSEWVSEKCSTTCGQGAYLRTRTCNNPAPSDGGQPCVGDSAEAQICNLLPCSNTGFVWTSWVSGKCSVTCGRGHQTRTRSCSKLAPIGRVQHCSSSGPKEQSAVCNLKPCSGGPCPSFTTRVNTRSLGCIQLPWINTLTDCQNYCATTIANCIAIEIDTSQGFIQCWVHVSPTSHLTTTLPAPNVNQYVLNGCPSPRTCSTAVPGTTLLTVYAGQGSLAGVDWPQFTDLNTCLNSCISDGPSCVGVDFTEGGGADSCWKYTSAANIGASIGHSPGVDQWRVTRC